MVGDVRVEPALHVDVSQMVGEDVHDCFLPCGRGLVDDLVHMPAE